MQWQDSAVSKIIRIAVRQFDVTYLLVQRDFKSRYKHTYIGKIWSLISPALFLAIFYFIFHSVLTIKIKYYASFILVGILFWQWFQSSLSQAAAAITSNPTLISQPGFPVSSLPIVSTLTNFINLAIALPLLAGILLLEGVAIGPGVFLIILLILIEFVVVLGLSYLIAALNVHFRDIEYALPIVLQIGYFVTPIFYDARQITGPAALAIYCNPMTWMIDAYRSVLIYNRVPQAAPLLLIGAGGLVLLVLSVIYFNRARSRFLEEL